MDVLQLQFVLEALSSFACLLVSALQVSGTDSQRKFSLIRVDLQAATKMDRIQQFRLFLTACCD